MYKKNGIFLIISIMKHHIFQRRVSQKDRTLIEGVGVGGGGGGWWGWVVGGRGGGVVVVVVVGVVKFIKP